MMTKQVLRASSVKESPFNSYKLIMMVPQRAHRGKVSRYDLKKIFYNNETPFIFEKYVTELKRIFNLLEKYGVPLF